jgi:hypothetical protein
MTKLKVEARSHGQFAIVNKNVSVIDTGNWDKQYVCLSGYGGPYPPELFASAPELLEESTFLLARIDELDWSMGKEEFARQWNGHVEPSLYRLGVAIRKVTGQ